MESSYKMNSQENEEEETEVLKKRISSHPLYGLLVQAHLDCLKVGNVVDLDQHHRSMKQKLLPAQMPSSSSLKPSELDQFMEAYCAALLSLKAAMEEPQEETVSFINSVHLQLRDLNTSHSAATAEPSASTGEGSNESHKG